MKNWVLTVSAAAERLAGWMRRIDRRIEGIALDAGGNTARQYEMILDLQDKKVRLINLGVLDGMLSRELGGGYELVKEYADGRSLTDIAKLRHVSRSTVYRRVQDALNRGGALLQREGYGEDILRKDYAAIRCVGKIAQRYSAV